MTPDLDTLLRDAGREPTVDLDVDALHTRGRRRAVGRLVAVGAGALALLGVLGVGAFTLIDQPDTPIVDQAPSEEAAPAPTPAPSEEGGREDRRAPTAAMADLGVTVVDVIRSNDGAGGLRVKVVTEDGVVDEFGTAAGALPPLASQVVVGLDRRLWFNDQDPNLLVGGRDDPMGGSVLRAQDGQGWVVLGTSEDGQPLVTQGIGPDGQFGPDLERRVQIVDGDVDDGLVRGISGIDVAAALGEEQPYTAHAIPEHLAVVSGIGESYTAWVFPAGAEPVVVAETGGFDSWFVDVAFVEEEIWIATGSPTGTDLWIASIDGDSVRRVPTPIGRGEDVDAFVVDLQAMNGTNGPVVTLSTATPSDENGVAWVVDVAAARAAAEIGEVGVDVKVPAGIYDVLDAEGHVHLLPPPADESADLAACATDGSYELNAAPSGFGGEVWWLCWDAVAALPDGVAHPFVASEEFSGGNGEFSADGLRAVVDRWAMGPGATAAAYGLSGSVTPEIATITDVAVDAGVVTVDLLPGPQVGVLGTTTGGSTFVMGLAGVVFQVGQVDALVITLAGSCEDWAALRESDGCPRYGEDLAPWWQGGVVTAIEEQYTP